MAFFAHLGTEYVTPLLTASATSSHDKILDDIVTDIGAGQDGWTVYDDRRNSTQLSASNEYAIYAPFRGHNTNSPGPTFTNASTTVTMPGSTGEPSRWFTPSASLSVDLVNWYKIATTGTAVTSITIDRTFAGTTSVYKPVWMTTYGYIVLQGTGSYRNMYLKINRTGAPALPLAVQAFDSWDNSTHVGTGGGPLEYVRGTTTAGALERPIQYFLKTDPHYFVLGTSVDYNDGGKIPGFDITYLGALSATNPFDSGSIVFGTTNQSVSGLYPQHALVTTTTRYNSLAGGASVIKSRNAASTWANPTIQDTATYENLGSIIPRGRPYFLDATCPARDYDRNVLITYMDFYQPGNFANIGSNNMLRGTVRGLMAPLTNPGGLHLTAFGPFSDGKKYLMLRLTPSDIPANSLTVTAVNFSVAANAWATFLGWGTRVGVVGEINTTPTAGQFIMGSTLIAMD
jgi:hypothetical protein